MQAYSTISIISVYFKIHNHECKTTAIAQGMRYVGLTLSCPMEDRNKDL